MKTQSEICEEKDGQLVTLEYLWQDKWIKSEFSPFGSVEEAKHCAEMMGVEVIRIQPYTGTLKKPYLPL